MKLEHYHYLLEVHRHRSISAAARKLRINQTTLSAIIKSAEEEVGFSIFQRTSGGVEPTNAGEEFLKLAWEIELQYEKLMKLKQRTSDSAPTVTIILSTSIAGKMAIPLLDRFYQYNVPGNVTFQVTYSEDTAEKIKNHQANIGIAFLSRSGLEALQRHQEEDGVIAEVLMEDKLYMMVEKDHPLAKEDVVSVLEISNNHLATVKPKMNDDMVLGLLRKVFPNVTCFASWDPFLSSIRDQGLVGFVPAFTWDEQNCDGCTLVPIKDTERENFLYLCLLTCKGRKLRHQEEILLKCIRDYFREQNEDKNGKGAVW